MRNSGRSAKICVSIVFIAILVVGLCVFDDYGISMDEPIQRQHSQISYRSAMRILAGREVFPAAGPSLSEYQYKCYGVAMQLPLVFTEDMFKLATGTQMPDYAVYRVRHLYTFLVNYVALICFYLLLKRLFEGRWLALVGVLMLLLFGRTFAHAFYNIKDMIFMPLFVIALCCAERIFATESKPVWCILFGLCGALLVSSRILGALLIVFVMAAMLWRDIAHVLARERAPDCAPSAKGLWHCILPYVLVFCAYPIWILITPAAWSNPLTFSLEYVQRFSDYTTFDKLDLFAGTIYRTGDMPSWYYLTWITFTVPIVNQLLCLVGIGCFAVPKTRRAMTSIQRVMLTIALGMLLVTLGYQFVFHPTVYGGWRHVCFLYSIIVLFAVFGLRRVWTWCGAQRKRLLQAGLGCMVAGSLVFNGVRIVQNHPHQYAMYNVIGRRYAKGFTRDYWNSSLLDLSKWVLSDSDAPRIKVSWYWADESYMQAMLPKEQADRLESVAKTDADYVITKYDWWAFEEEDGEERIQGLEGFEEVYVITVDGVKLSSVFRRIAN